MTKSSMTRIEASFLPILTLDRPEIEERADPGGSARPRFFPALLQPLHVGERPLVPAAGDWDQLAVVEGDENGRVESPKESRADGRMPLWEACKGLLSPPSLEEEFETTEL